MNNLVFKQEVQKEIEKMAYRETHKTAATLGQQIQRINNKKAKLVHRPKVRPAQHPAL